SSVTIRLDDDTKLDALDKLAAGMDRSRNWLINRAIERYIAEQSWQIARIREGIADADRRDFASEGEVEAAFARFGAKAKAAE
ncbi:MAG: CopG family ribbon-helix-helix protein, partial [Bosea sp. (in: a-proteobacteria)]